MQDLTRDLPDAEPEFFKVYVEYVALLNKLPKNSDRLLRLLARQMGFDSGFIPINKALKEMWAKELDYKSSQQIDNQIQAMLKSKVLLREAKGLYKINPMLVAKGSWKEIRKCRQAWIHIHIKNGEEYITTGME